MTLSWPLEPQGRVDFCCCRDLVGDTVGKLGLNNTGATCRTEKFKLYPVDSEGPCGNSQLRNALMEAVF